MAQLITMVLMAGLLIPVSRGLIALGDWLHGMYERGGPWGSWP